VATANVTPSHFEASGEGGIRTPDGLIAHTGFRDRGDRRQKPMRKGVSLWGNEERNGVPSAGAQLLALALRQDGALRRSDGTIGLILARCEPGRLLAECRDRSRRRVCRAAAISGSTATLELASVAGVEERGERSAERADDVFPALRGDAHDPGGDGSAFFSCDEIVREEETPRPLNRGSAGLSAISWVGTCEMSGSGCRLKAHVRVRPDAAGG
jgi:hypothetical protein